MTAPTTSPRALERTFLPRRPIDVRLTLGRVSRRPVVLVRPEGVWWATAAPSGPATVLVGARAGGEVSVRAWGPGAAETLDGAPTILGEGDACDDFRPRHRVVAALHQRFPGLRIPRTGRVFEALVPVVIEQKVIGLEAHRSYAGLVRRHGARPPGPVGVVPAALRLPPPPALVAALPAHAFQPLGVEAKRADTIRLAARHAARLEEAAAMAPADAARRLQVLPGIGPWTAAEVAIVALGDADAVSVGDYHLPNLVAWRLAGEARADDERMLELLEPFRGHRGRVIRLLEAAGPRAPRYGPRLPLRNLAAG